MRTTNDRTIPETTASIMTLQVTHDLGRTPVSGNPDRKHARSSAQLRPLWRIFKSFTSILSALLPGLVGNWGSVPLAFPSPLPHASNQPAWPCVSAAAEPSASGKLGARTQGPLSCCFLGTCSLWSCHVLVVPPWKGAGPSQHRSLPWPHLGKVPLLQPRPLQGV